MSLVACRHCESHQVADSAKACPSCGGAYPGALLYATLSGFAKALVFLLVVVFLLGVVF